MSIRLHISLVVLGYMYFKYELRLPTLALAIEYSVDHYIILSQFAS